MTIGRWLKFLGMPWSGGLMALATVAMVMTQAPVTADYSVAIAAAAFSALYLVAPVVAGTAAWAGWRLSRSSATLRAASRGTARIGGQVVIGLVVVAVLEMWFVALAQLWMAGERTLPDVKIVLAAIAVLAGSGSVGFALGVKFHALIAVPVALAISYLWLVIPLTLEPLWLRQLTGIWGGCCQSDQRVWSAAVFAVLVLNAGLVGAACWFVDGTWRGQARRVWVAGPAATLVVGAVMATVLIGGRGVDATEPRATALTCGSSSPQVCVWPEHRVLLPRVESAAATVADALASSGFEAPTVLTEAAVPGAGQRKVALVRGLKDDEITMAVLAAFSPSPTPNCQDKISRSGQAGVQLAFAASAAGHLLAERVGVTEDSEIQGGPEADLTRRILNRSKAQQDAWLIQATRAVQSCDPSLVPG